MTRGAQAGWRWSRARFFADGAVPRRGELELAGGAGLLPARTRAPTAGSRWARWSRSSGRRCARARPRGPARAPLDPAGRRPSSRRSSPRARAPSGRRSTTRTAAAWSRCSSSTRRSPRAPEIVVAVDQPGAAAPVRLLGAAGRALAHAGRRHAPGPGARRGHRRGARGAGLRLGGDRALQAAGAVAGPSVPAGSFLADRRPG